MHNLRILSTALILGAFVCVCSTLYAEPPVGIDRYTDEALKQLPATIETLSLRGSHGYGVDEISEPVFIAEMRRFTKLRVLHAAALGLTDQCLEAIGELSDLEELSLSINQIEGTGLHHLTKLKKLKKLYLNSNPLNANWPSKLSRLNSLEELQAGNYDQALNDEMCRELSKLTQLRRVELNDNAREVTDAGLLALASLRHLKSINLNEAQVTNEGLAQLATLADLEQLRLRNLRRVSEGCLVWIPKLQHLKELEISGTALNAQDIAAINKLSGLTSLLVWNVSYGPQPLYIERLDGLTSLRAIRTNEVLKPTAICDLSRIESVEYIGDDLALISDEEIIELAKLPRLRSLTLDSPLVTEQSLDALKEIQSLRYLSVSDKVKLTAQQLEQLGSESLVKCQIIARSGGKVYHEPKIND